MNLDNNISKVVEMLLSGKVGAIYEGYAESGSRALGHRSIIANPTIKNGKDIVNHIKKREEFRPFAGSVLEDHADKWFDLVHINGKSPHMLYTVPVVKNKRKIIPAITHIDGSCRVQTVEKNTVFYNIIYEFFKKTKVPILLNTSFNLAGKPLVHTFSDAEETFYNSELFFLLNIDNNNLKVKV